MTADFALQVNFGRYGVAAATTSDRADVGGGGVVEADGIAGGSGDSADIKSWEG